MINQFHFLFSYLDIVHALYFQFEIERTVIHFLATMEQFVVVVCFHSEILLINQTSILCTKSHLLP